MDQKTLVILQKTESPFRQLVRKTVDQKGCAKVFPEHDQPLPEEVSGPQSLVLWDISGFTQDEVVRITAELEAKDAGTIVLCKVWDEFCIRILRQLKVLEFVADPNSVVCLTQALDSAWLLRVRLWRLKEECLELSRHLGERRIIDEAKWLLVRHKGLTEDEALRRMQAHSRKTNQKLLAVAQNLLAGYEKMADQINYLSDC